MRYLIEFKKEAINNIKEIRDTWANNQKTKFEKFIFFIFNDDFDDDSLIVNFKCKIIIDKLVYVNLDLLYKHLESINHTDKNIIYLKNLKSNIMTYCNKIEIYDIHNKWSSNNRSIVYNTNNTFISLGGACIVSSAFYNLKIREQPLIFDYSVSRIHGVYLGLLSNKLYNPQYNMDKKTTWCNFSYNSIIGYPHHYFYYNNSKNITDNIKNKNNLWIEIPEINKNITKLKHYNSSEIIENNVKIEKKDDKFKNSCIMFSNKDLMNITYNKIKNLKTLLYQNNKSILFRYIIENIDTEIYYCKKIINYLKKQNVNFKLVLIFPPGKNFNNVYRFYINDLDAECWISNWGNFNYIPTFYLKENKFVADINYDDFFEKHYFFKGGIQNCLKFWEWKTCIGKAENITTSKALGEIIPQKIAVLINNPSIKINKEYFEKKFNINIYYYNEIEKSIDINIIDNLEQIMLNTVLNIKFNNLLLINTDFEKYINKIDKLPIKNNKIYRFKGTNNFFISYFSCLLDFNLYSEEIDI